MLKYVITAAVVLALSAGYAQAEEGKVMPRKVEVDSNYDGKPDRVEYYNPSGEAERVEIDRNFDGKYDEWIYYKNGEVFKVEKDTNADGKPDTWIEY